MLLWTSYLILGNHELFGVSRQEGLRLADKLQGDPELKGKLIVTHRKRVDLQDVTIRRYQSTFHPEKVIEG